MPKIPSVGRKIHPTPDLGDFLFETFVGEGGGTDVDQINTMQTFRNNLHETNLPEEEQVFLHEKLRAFQTYLAKKIYNELLEYDFSEELTSMGGKSARRGRKKLNKKRITRKNK